ncbi:VCBS repeat-containing protein [Arcicella sp. LKC2W]|uniref:VCBS repeat-containing protein n=1 Tax=Arcicella sp. LKC2W TaxID=2984198 RepID=UPI002B21DF2D|nr:VCBS repeat-containing protein [Arcicella sp. LKC2W]MEA5461801.1 VCBS repeat-containing protein [Arcicella sp. LKC2W]
MKKIFLLLIGTVTFSCNQKNSDTLFEELPASETGVDFANKSLEKDDFNIFRYRNFYNGGGVAIGDVNNDGFADIFLTSNFEDNKLYLNKGNKTSIQFEDVTKQAGIIGKKFWSTGVTFADVNGDGFLDIYVCNSGSRDARGNQLYINNGVKNGKVTFTEKAKEYGLEDGGFSTHAAFFDYDRDGDLDMYSLNNSFTPMDRLGYANLRNERDKLGGDKLFRNDNGHFTDVSEAAGIFGSLIGFGLGITIGDVNNDNWLDIYISNDFYERDYLYINQKNGTFKEDLENQMPHISLSSMGADIADINNDGNLDIFVTDMLPEGDERLKKTTTFDGYDLNEFKVKQGYHHQSARNMLHVNNGDGTFSESGELAGVHATDWSWGALMFDMDNDGQKDLFVANGINKDLTDQDYVAFLGDDKTKQQSIQDPKFNPKDLINKTPSTPIPNYAFRNLGGLRFENASQNFGLDRMGFSNGSAYGDLDNDGDLDLVVNNNNDPVSIYRNKENETLKNHYLRVKLKGTAKNLDGIGSTVKIYQKSQCQTLQQMPNRGFQSSVDLTLNFGLGQNAAIDSLVIVWNDDKKQVLKNPKSDQLLVLDYKNANQLFKFQPLVTSLPFTDITTQTLDFKHVENDFVDYNRDLLLKQKYSTQGPALAIGDVNGDGLDDTYIGGSQGFAKNLYIQQKNGKMLPAKTEAFNRDNYLEIVDALFFDADNDKDLDLYLVTGSNEYNPDDLQLRDRLYMNDGKGNFIENANLPAILASGSCVKAGDYDKDGDLDLFIGSRLTPTLYGRNPESTLLKNDGKGNFKDVSKTVLGDARNLGMVTDVAWLDVNGDKYPELILVGDWMSVTILKNEKGTFKKDTDSEVPVSNGWWNCIQPADIDGDGDTDFVLGNLGLNHNFKASENEPVELHVNDFDKNGTTEQIITCYRQGKSCPAILKSDLQKQIPTVKQKFLKFSDYAKASINDLFSDAQMAGKTLQMVNNTESSFLINEGNGKFSLKALPLEAQISPINSIQIVDYNKDGNQDILLAGNFFDNIPEVGRYDANYGIILAGKGKGKYDVQTSKQTGFFTKGQVRKMRVINSLGGKKEVVLVKNNEKAQVFGLK